MVRPSVTRVPDAVRVPIPSLLSGIRRHRHVVQYLAVFKINACPRNHVVLDSLGGRYFSCRTI